MCGLCRPLVVTCYSAGTMLIYWERSGGNRSLKTEKNPRQTDRDVVVHWLSEEGFSHFCIPGAGHIFGALTLLTHSEEKPQSVNGHRKWLSPMPG